MKEDLEERKKKIADVASRLVFGSLDDAKCKKHRKSEDEETECVDCTEIKEAVSKFNCHSCTFSCQKKKKYILIRENEGHGRFDKKLTGPAMECPKCRFNYPFFPLDETIFLQGITKDLSEDDVKKRKNDLLKIRKFLLRQTNGYKEESDSWKKLKSLTFWEFLYEVGMFEGNKDLCDFNEKEKLTAKTRYLNAITASIRGTGSVFLKRKTSDLFINNFNPNLMKLHKANHDIQIVVDQYACAQYICGYLTKNEQGMSQLLKNINDNANNFSHMELLDKLAAVIDKHREVSIQEAIYRLMGMSMTKSSVKIKYLSTVHPNFRDGLLKGNIEDLDESESIFHNSPHTYYESRPDVTDLTYQDEYHPVELDLDWENLTLSEFWSWYEIIYEKSRKISRPFGSHQLKNGKGFIKRRTRQAVLRYYLPFENLEDYCRGLLILFYPFRDEMNDIHSKDVRKVVIENNDKILKIKNQFEAHQVMTDIINEVQKQYENQVENEDEDEIEDEKDIFAETTSEKEIKDFDEWAKNQADKHLKTVQQFTNLISIESLRVRIIELNEEQRKIFDDIMEREVDICHNPEAKKFHLYISGDAGTGKSHVMRVMMEGTKRIHIKAGNELNKPSIISLAPTANAAYIVGAKTIESALCFNRNRNYVKLSPSREANLKFLYEDVATIFCDEISMVGSRRLTKINFRMQDLADGDDKYKFLGGKSSMATGDYYQLPPVKDGQTFDKNHLDGRPDCAPSHWDDNYEIYHLTEKVRSAGDAKFGEVCDRIGKGCLLPEDEEYLKKLVRKCPNENDNESFKTGKISIIVTTNKKREKHNLEKLEKLLPDTDAVLCNSKDNSTNIANPPQLGDDLNYTETGNLQKSLKLKVGAPIMITVNHAKAKYREDGVCNGARAYIDSFQKASENSTEIQYIWVVFKNKQIGQQLRIDNLHLLQKHKPNHPKAVPIEVCKIKFNVRSGNVNYQRTQFPAVLAYAVTS